MCLPSAVRESWMLRKSPPKEQRYIQSIEIGFQIIDVLRRSPRNLPLKEIAQKAGMTPTKAHLYLAAFARVGIVSQDANTSRYGLGPEAVHLGLAAIAQLDIVSASAAVMEELYQRYNVSVCLSIWGDVGPTIIRKLDPKQALPNTLRIGRSVPLLWSATGQVFAAFDPDGRAANILDQEIAGRKDFAQRAERNTKFVRQHGFAWSESQLNQGFSAMAAPIFDYENWMVATLTFIGLGQQIDPNPKGEMAKALLAGAQQISEAMCHIEGTPAEDTGQKSSTKRKDASVPT